VVTPEYAMAAQPAVSVVYHNAEVCREDLLVEIEATGGAGSRTTRRW
jgi:hypothetical protein